MIDNYLKNQYTKAIKRHPSYVYKDILYGWELI